VGTERSTFIIDENGQISAILEKVKPEEHLDEVLKLL
jgi:peroxiredoxin